MGTATSAPVADAPTDSTMEWTTSRLMSQTVTSRSDLTDDLLLLLVNRPQATIAEVRVELKDELIRTHTREQLQSVQTAAMRYALSASSV